MKVEIWLVHWSWHHQNQHAASWKPQCKSACWVPGPGPASCSTQTLETLPRCLHRMTLFHTGSHHVSVIFVCVAQRGPNGKCANRQLAPLAQAPRMWNLPRTRNIYRNWRHLWILEILTHLGFLKDLRAHVSFLRTNHPQGQWFDNIQYSVSMCINIYIYINIIIHLLYHNISYVYWLIFLPLLAPLVKTPVTFFYPNALLVITVRWWAHLHSNLRSQKRNGRLQSSYISTYLFASSESTKGVGKSMNTSCGMAGQSFWKGWHQDSTKSTKTHKNGNVIVFAHGKPGARLAWLQDESSQTINSRPMQSLDEQTDNADISIRRRTWYVVVVTCWIAIRFRGLLHAKNCKVNTFSEAKFEIAVLRLRGIARPQLNLYDQCSSSEISWVSDRSLARPNRESQKRSCRKGRFLLKSRRTGYLWIPVPSWSILYLWNPLKSHV